MIRFFQTPKPRQFHYRPWFYNPEKEELEALAKKYQTKGVISEDDASELDYYRKKVKQFDLEKTKKNTAFFSKKARRKFTYQSRFASKDDLLGENQIDAKKYQFKSMFDDEKLFAKPIPVSRIFLIATLATLLLLWIFF